jgi:hypothetical protein
MFRTSDKTLACKLKTEYNVILLVKPEYGVIIRIVFGKNYFLGAIASTWLLLLTLDPPSMG